MLRQNLTMAARVLLKYRLYTTLSVLSLVFGFAIFLLSVVLVENIGSLDRNLTQYDRIYNVYSQWNGQSGSQPGNVATSFFTLEELRSHIPEIERATHVTISAADYWLVTVGQTREYEQLIFADSGFFDVFDFPMVEGTGSNALDRPYSIVISEEMAVQYFGEDSPVGRTLTIDNEYEFTITAVIQNLPSNSLFTMAGGGLDFIISFETVRQMLPQFPLFSSWSSGGVAAFAVLPPKLSYSDLRTRLRTLAQDRWPEPYNETIEIKARHLGEIADDLFRLGRVSASQLNFALGVFVLAVGCINFINLLIAQNVGRAREIALRKIAGASRRSILMQFFTEAFLLTAMGLGFGLFFASYLLPIVGDPPNIVFTMAAVERSQLLWWLTGLCLGVAALGGLCPAILLARMRPQAGLTGQFSTGRFIPKFHSVAVTFQFMLATILVVAALVAWLQGRHLRALDLGYNIEQVLILDKVRKGPIRPNYPTLKTALSNLDGVSVVSASNAIPGINQGAYRRLMRADGNADEFFDIRRINIDFDFFEAMDIKFAAGRDLSPSFANDSKKASEAWGDVSTLNVVLNRSAAEKFGWPDPNDAIGQVVTGIPESDMRDVQSNLVIVGVVEDTHFRVGGFGSDPHFYRIDDGAARSGIVKVSTSDLQGVLDGIRSIWAEVNPGYPIQIGFLDERFDRLYEQLSSTENTLFWICAFAIAIAAFGLFGLAGFVSARRTREFGIRKATGAGVIRIVRLLLWDFGKPVLVANALAWPIAFLILRGYLDTMAERIDLHVWQFGAAALFTLSVAWITVTWHVIRAAHTHPATALRYE